MRSLRAIFLSGICVMGAKRACLRFDLYHRLALVRRYIGTCFDWRENAAQIQQQQQQRRLWCRRARVIITCVLRVAIPAMTQVRESALYSLLVYIIYGKRGCWLFISSEKDSSVRRVRYVEIYSPVTKSISARLLNIGCRLYLYRGFSHIWNANFLPLLILLFKVPII